MSALHFGAVLSSFISLLCLILALATDYWIANSLPGTRLGLWKVCKDRECYQLDVELVRGSLRAVQTFMFLGMISGVVSLGGLCFLFWKPLLGNISMSSTAWYGSFSAGLCVMIAMSIFTGITATTYYGWSFGLGWASFPLYLITGGLAYTLHRSTAATA
ncbi:lens fiber membrane intrinsic protein-like [Thamnophis elegans]|uniref:lens fiber membrane intrinsic protein-like n=1 Tax=Thamnophis elegans TaxID=35005 RepID=UPI00137789B5|nr:lens fiber membrane intrinsic protein-like [Thamnophis elegans]